jgi:hypothetical protein
MKTALSRFTIVGVVTLSVGLSLAGDRPRQKKDVLPAHPVGQSSSKQVVKIPQESGEKRTGIIPGKSSPIHSLDQPGLKAAAGLEAGELAMRKTAMVREQTAELSAEVWTPAKSPGVHSERALPATGLGGPATPGGKYSAGAINGTLIKRRP